jgi:hypothetical protein
VILGSYDDLNEYMLSTSLKHIPFDFDKSSLECHSDYDDTIEANDGSIDEETMSLINE